jgi:hypothetical protein
LNPVPDDAAQPAAEFVRLTQGPEVCPRGNERFLGYILALAHVAGGTIRQGADQGLVSLNNPAEGILAAIQAFGHQISIVAFLRMHRFGCHHIILQVPEKHQKVTENCTASAGIPAAP